MKLEGHGCALQVEIVQRVCLKQAQAAAIRFHVAVSEGSFWVRGNGATEATTILPCVCTVLVLNLRSKNGCP